MVVSWVCREQCPDGVQKLLATYQWDADLVRDGLRSYLVEHLGWLKLESRAAISDACTRHRRGPHPHTPSGGSGDFPSPFYHRSLPVQLCVADFRLLTDQPFACVLFL